MKPRPVKQVFRSSAHRKTIQHQTDQSLHLYTQERKNAPIIFIFISVFCFRTLCGSLSRLQQRESETFGCLTLKNIWTLFSRKKPSASSLLSFSRKLEFLFICCHVLFFCHTFFYNEAVAQWSFVHTTDRWLTHIRLYIIQKLLNQANMT